MDADSVLRAVKLIKASEGYERFPYRDPVGKLSIGHGRNLSDVGISEWEAMQLLDHDVVDALAALERYPWFDGLLAARQAALLDLMVNIGAKRFTTFVRMIAALAAADYQAAANQMLESRWATQVGERAQRDAGMLRTGWWPDPK